MDAIRTVSLGKDYKAVKAVDRLDLNIAQGEIFSLLGVNGAGKTTVVKMLCGLTSPSRGEAFVGGYSVINESEKVKTIIGVSPQETAVAMGLTVRENLEFVCKLYGFSKEKTALKVKELTEDFQLLSVIDRKAGKLSGGFQRRVSIAMALIGEPRVLFLDEPTLGLDVVARHRLWEVILKLKGKITIVLTTHYLEEAKVLADRVGIMKNGRLLALGTVEEINRQMETDDFEAAFVSIVKEGQE